MVTNGLMRAKELGDAEITRMWIEFIDRVARKAFVDWTESEFAQQQFFRGRRLNFIRLELERTLLESYAPWLRNRPFDLDELKCETDEIWRKTRGKVAKKLFKRS